MSAEAHPAIFLVTAILMLLAIVSKLVTANLVTRSKRAYTKLEAQRRDISSRLKEAQLKTTSAKGTLEFWERRRTETSQREQDMMRDMAEYDERFQSEEGDEGEEMSSEAASADAAGDGQTDPDAEQEPGEAGHPAAPAAIGEETGSEEEEGGGDGQVVDEREESNRPSSAG
jgi:hypothetical protein